MDNGLFSSEWLSPQINCAGRCSEVLNFGARIACHTAGVTEWRTRLIYTVPLDSICTSLSREEIESKFAMRMP